MRGGGGGGGETYESNMSTSKLGGLTQHNTFTKCDPFMTQTYGC
jgi:hypothetical protein